MVHPGFDAFGRPIHPQGLSRIHRIEILCRVAEGMSASSDPAARWIGNGILKAMRNGSQIERALGVSAPPGSRTASTILRVLHRDAALLELSVIAGGDRKAREVLSSELPFPSQAKHLLDLLPRRVGPAAFSRARRRLGLSQASRTPGNHYCITEERTRSEPTKSMITSRRRSGMQTQLSPQKLADLVIDATAPKMQQLKSKTATNSMMLRMLDLKIASLEGKIERLEWRLQQARRR